MKVLHCIICFAFLLLAAGCGHTHKMISINVPKTGDKTVKTKYHYKVNMEKAHYNLERYQPEVFSQDGIPIIINEVNVKEEEGDYFWTGILAVHTIGILPMVETLHSHYRWEISVLGHASTKTTISSCEHVRGAFGGPSPFPLLLFWGSDSCLKDSRSFDEHYFNMDKVGVGGNYRKEAVAYGVAVKLKELEESGKINDQIAAKAIAKQKLSSVALVQTEINEPDFKRKGSSIKLTSGNRQYKFEIVAYDLEEGKDYAHRFIISTDDALSIPDYSAIRAALLSSIKEDYLQTHPNINPRSIVVDFPEYSIEGGFIKGRCVILTLSVESMTYSPSTRKGRLSININASQFEDVRQWIRKNIGALVAEASKDVKAGSGIIGDCYYTGNEALKDNGILEVDFRME